MPLNSNDSDIDPNRLDSKIKHHTLIIQATNKKDFIMEKLIASSNVIDEYDVSIGMSFEQLMKKPPPN